MRSCPQRMPDLQLILMGCAWRARARIGTHASARMGAVVRVKARLAAHGRAARPGVDASMARHVARPSAARDARVRGPPLLRGVHGWPVREQACCWSRLLDGSGIDSWGLERTALRREVRAYGFLHPGAGRLRPHDELVASSSGIPVRQGPGLCRSRDGAGHVRCVDRPERSRWWPQQVVMVLPLPQRGPDTRGRLA